MDRLKLGMVRWGMREGRGRRRERRGRRRERETIHYATS